MEGATLAASVVSSSGIGSSRFFQLVSDVARFSVVNFSGIGRSRSVVLDSHLSVGLDSFSLSATF